MKLRAFLLAATAAQAFSAVSADAKPAKLHRPVVSNEKLMAEIEELKAQVAELRAARAEQAGVTQAELAQVQRKAESAEAATARQVAMVPEAVHAEVVKEADAAAEKARHQDKFYYKGITLTPGGFLEAAAVYRQHFQGNDLASSFAIPFPNNHASHVTEGRLSARQSRLSLLAEGQVNSDVKLSMYGEFDFLGAAQTANSNESNSFTPRIRNVYGTIDWSGGDSGWHVLAGQNWSLVTANAKGITPRNELMPPQIDAQYIPGFTWARQPQLRLTGDFLDHSLWVAVSVENPATTFGGAVPATATVTAPAGSGFDSGNSLSLNHSPDVVGKVAYEADLGGRSLHLEGFGLARSFEAHSNGGGNDTGHGVGYGGTVELQVVPGVFDAQFTGMGGKGIGRYGSAQLPDATVGADGRVHAIDEIMLLGGLTLHATKILDVYGFAGEEREKREILGAFGLGLPTADDSGCFVEGGTCAGNTRRIRQLTFGLWDKIYQGPFGRAQVGLQYSYTERQLFPTATLLNGPEVHQNMGFVSFRYYPF